MQLIINTYGAYLHIKDEMFEVIIRKDGISKKHYFSFKKVKSILMSKGTAMSSDAIISAIKNNIDIVIMEHNGTPVGRFWHSRPGSTTKIRKKQLEASVGKTGLKWIKNWLTQKLQNQIDFLKRLKKHRSTKAEEIQEIIDKIENLKTKILEAEAEKVSEIEDSLRG